MHICLSAPNTLGYPDGGHLWVFINWALGFRSLGHQVTWLDVIGENDTFADVDQMLGKFRARLEPFGLQDSLALCTSEGMRWEHERELPLRPLAQALSADVLCDHRYNTPDAVIKAFGKSMFIDIDPGQLQYAIEWGTYRLGKHSTFFTVGEWTKFAAVDPPPFKTFDVEWHYTPPPVALDQWPVSTAHAVEAMTTVSNWFMEDTYMPDEAGNYYDNSKRAAFQDYLNIPECSPLPLELCLNLGGYREETELLQHKGWRIRESSTIAPPAEYRSYIQNSLGEFSCAKPSYVRMKTGWLSDRTACYLASGKPAVVQRTGKSSYLDNGSGILRFDDPESAVRALQEVQQNYPKHAAAARSLAETFLDARVVLKRALDVCFG